MPAREASPRNSTELMPISTSSSDQTLRPGDSATEAEDAPCSSSWGSQQQQQQLANAQEPARVTTSEPHTQHGWLQGLGAAAAAAAQRLHLTTTVEPVYQRLHTESDADNVHDSAELVASSPTAKLLQEQHAARQQASQGHQQHSSSSSGVGNEEAVRFSMLQFIRFCGSGLLMSVSFLDPGNLEADIQVGVSTGYDLLWWYFICAVLFGLAFQNLSGQLGLVTGQDLAQHCGKRYPKFARVLLWLLLEIAIVGADIQETIGSAIALAILSGGRLPLWAGCIIISVTAFLLLLLDRVGFRQLEAVFAVFIGVEAVALGMNFFQAGIPAKDLARGLLIPTLTRRSLPVAVGALGALIMPYNLFFASSIVNSRPRGADTEAKTAMLLTYMRMENFAMLLLAFLINVFVVCVFAKGFYLPAVATGTQPPDIGLETAGEHLADEFGDSFRTVWAVGLLASGQVATISLTYAGQLVMTGLLGLKVQAGLRMVATRMVALVPTVIMAVVFEASNTFDIAAQLLNVAQSVLLPFALLPVVHMTANREVMGERFAARRWLTGLTAAITAAIVAVNGYLLYDVIMQQHQDGLGPEWIAGLVLIMLAYYSLILYFAIGPDNLPRLLTSAAEAAKGVTSLVRGRRRMDYESMLEVHW